MLHHTEQVARSDPNLIGGQGWKKLFRRPDAYIELLVLQFTHFPQKMQHIKAFRDLTKALENHSRKIQRGTHI